jgi:hypothetical protein
MVGNRNGLDDRGREPLVQACLIRDTRLVPLALLQAVRRKPRPVSMRGLHRRMSMFEFVS